MKKKTLRLAAISLTAVAFAALVVVTAGTRRRLSFARLDLEQYRSTLADLKERIGEAESETDSAKQVTRKLRQELSALTKEQKEDSVVIEQLWGALQRNTRAGRKDSAEGEGAKYDVEAMKKLLTSSEGDLDGLISQILTAEGLSSTLEDHSEDPTYWVTAASLVKDKDEALKYLEEAATLFPKSAVVLSSLVEALMAKGQFDESTMAHIATLKQVDPANSLPDYYEANCRFQSGDIQGALQCLSEASLKDRFADNGINLLMARYDYFLNEGCSDSTAMVLSS